MRALSESTLASIQELYAFAGKGAPLAPLEARLQAIGDAGEPLALPRMISFALDPRRDLAEAAGRTAARLLERVALTDLGFLDRAFRELSPYLHPEAEAWQRMGPDELRSVAALSSGAALLQLAMCHPSGYVRAEAIRRSAVCADGSEIALLLVRSNDWVEPVRALALAALRVRLDAAHVPDFVAALPLIDTMRSWGRGISTDIVDEIDALLRQPGGISALVAALASPDRLVRRAAYRRLAEHDRPVPSSSLPDPHAGGPYRQPGVLARTTHAVVASAMRDPDPSIRTWAGRWMLAARSDVFLGAADELVRSRTGAIRLGAMQRLRALGAPVPWAALLADRHAGVRGLAQEIALDAGADPDAAYRGQLDALGGGRLAAVLLGLSETGGPGDADLVRRYLASEPPVVRASALRALANFEADDLVALALAALDDESLSMLRVAREVLLAHMPSLHAEAVWSRFLELSSAAGRAVALDVLASVGHWEGLPYLLRAFAVGDAATQQLVVRRVERWLGSGTVVFVSVAPALAAELLHLLAASTLPGELRGQLVQIVEARTRPARPR